MIKISSEDFDIAQIANSGQCFRISEKTAGIWKVIAFGKTLQIYAPNAHSEDKNHYFCCSEQEYNEVWCDYFDMNNDYGEIKRKISATNDEYLINAINFGHGIRILNQDLWEVIISFIISQQNNIPRIRKIIKKLCEPYEQNHFPSPDELAKYSENDLTNIGLGYRAKYIRDISIAVAEGKLNLDQLRLMNYQEAIAALKKFRGIGDKVANCIALFGLRKLEAFPIDVWIKRVLQNHYNGQFAVSRFPQYAGIVQQYMFYYERFNNDK